MEQIVSALRDLMPTVTFVSAESFYWSPRKQEVYYVDRNQENDVWALLHEASHALLDHTSYNSDFELLQLEVAAWEEAKNLGKKFDLEVDEDHVQDCLDTYRDWLHQRSTCPSCSSVSLQSSANEYKCHNCYTVWQVSNSRFCRPYRLRTAAPSKKSSESKPQTTFA